MSPAVTRWHPLLRVGELVEHDGEPHTVVKVSAGAAHLARGDWRTEEGVLEREWTALKAVSPRAMVRRLA